VTNLSKENSDNKNHYTLNTSLRQVGGARGYMTTMLVLLG